MYSCAISSSLVWANDGVHAPRSRAAAAAMILNGLEKQFEPRNPVLSCAETETDAGAGQHLMDDDQADALAVGLSGEEGGEEVAGGLLGDRVSVVGHAPPAAAGDDDDTGVRGAVTMKVLFYLLPILK